MSSEATQRAPMSGTVKYFDWNRPREAEAVEISAGGIFLQTAEPLAEDRLVTVRVSLPGRRPFTVLGKVVRTVRGSLLRPGGMDIRFVDIAAHDRETVAHYVAERSRTAA
jgi:uncharacterized protein (TIGR02266 family)